MELFILSIAPQESGTKVSYDHDNERNARYATDGRLCRHLLSQATYRDVHARPNVLPTCAGVI